MPKHYLRKWRSSPKIHWCPIHNAKGATLAAGEQTNITMISSDTPQKGTRTYKCKDITITGPGEGGLVYWALVYVPESSSIQSINVSTATSSSDMYEPEQYVLAAGVHNFVAGPARIRTPVKRKLYEGDTIYLCIRNPSTSSTQIGLVHNGFVRYG